MPHATHTTKLAATESVLSRDNNKTDYYYTQLFFSFYLPFEQSLWTYLQIFQGRSLSFVRQRSLHEHKFCFRVGKWKSKSCYYK